MKKSVRPSLAVIIILFLVIGAISDIGGAWTLWLDIFDWVKEKLGLQEQGLVINIVLFVLAIAIIALLVAAIRKLSDENDEKKIAREEKEEKEIREIYLNWLQKEVQGRLDKSLHLAPFENLKLSEKQGAVLPWYQIAQSSTIAPRKFDTFWEAFELFERRVLLLGAPGSGKTTTLQHLAKSLVEEAIAYDGKPIPVLLNLSKFADIFQLSERRTLFGIHMPGGKVPDAAKREAQLIEDWLIKLVTELPGMRHHGSHIRRWIQTGRIALLLDGLDEVHEDRIDRLVQLLNESYFRDHPEMTTVVCSRIIEYRPLEHDPNKQLRLNGTVTLQPLRPEQIRNYLETVNLTELSQALESDVVLREMAETPLTLSMMALAYGRQGLQDEDIRPELSLVERRRKLFDAYTEQVMQREVFRRRYPDQIFEFITRQKTNQTLYGLQEVHRYLGWLAIQLSIRSLTVFPVGRLYSLLKSDHEAGFNPTIITNCIVLFALTLIMGVSLSLVEVGQGIGWTIFSAIAACAFYLGFIRFVDEKTRIPNHVDSYLQAAAVGHAFITYGVFVLTLAKLLPFSASPISIGVIVCLLILYSILYNESPIHERRRVIALHIIFVGIPIIPFALMQQFSALLDIAALGMIFSILTWVTVFLINGDIVEDNIAALGILALCSISMVIIIFLFNIILYIISDIEGWEVLFFTALALDYGFIFEVSHDELSFKTIPVTATIGFCLGGFINGLNAAIVGATISALLGWHLRSILYPLVETAFYNVVLLKVLALQRRVAPRYRQFLEYAVDAFLLKQEDREYAFVHRVLRDHFAIRDIIPLLQRASGDSLIMLVDRLSRQGDSAFEALKGLVEHPNPLARRASVIGLGRIASQGTEVTLLNVLQDTTNQPSIVRKTVMESLGRLDKAYVDSFFEIALNDEDEQVRRIAAENVRWSTNPSQWINHALKDQAESVFLNALSSMDLDEHYGKFNNKYYYTSIYTVKSTKMDLNDIDNNSKERISLYSRDMFLHATPKVQFALMIYFPQICSLTNILTVLHHPEAAVRFAAIYALRELRNWDAILPLFERLVDTHSVMGVGNAEFI